MTIATQSRTAGPFECNGSTTVYPFTFKVFTASDVSVIFRNTASGDETKLVLNIDYTVALNSNQNANPGGSITINGPAYESGNTLTLTSELQYLQPTDLTNNGGFYPKVISDALDRLTIFAQQIRGLATRSLKFPISDGNLDATVPGKDQRKGRVLAFDAVTGLPMPGPLVEGIGAGANYIGESAPTSAYSGMRWYNPAIPTTFVYYIDGDSAQWVEEASQSTDGGLRADLANSNSLVPIAGVPAYKLKATKVFGHYVGNRDDAASVAAGWTAMVADLQDGDVVFFDGMFKTPVQDDQLILDSVNNVTFFGGGFYRWAGCAEHIIRFHTCEGIVVHGMTFQGVDTAWFQWGYQGLYFRDCVNTRVDSCKFNDIGDAAIRTCRVTETYYPPTTVGMVISNCFFTNCTQVTTSGTGALKFIFTGNVCENMYSLKIARRNTEPTGWHLIYGNHFNNCEMGVELQGANKVRYTNNTVLGASLARLYRNDETFGATWVANKDIIIHDNDFIATSNADCIYINNENSNILTPTDVAGFIQITNNRMTQNFAGGRGAIFVSSYAGAKLTDKLTISGNYFLGSQHLSAMAALSNNPLSMDGMDLEICNNKGSFTSWFVSLNFYLNPTVTNGSFVCEGNQVYSAGIIDTFVFSVIESSAVLREFVVNNNTFKTTGNLQHLKLGISDRLPLGQHVEVVGNTFKVDTNTGGDMIRFCAPPASRAADFSYLIADNSFLLTGTFTTGPNQPRSMIAPTQPTFGSVYPQNAILRENVWVGANARIPRSDNSAIPFSMRTFVRRSRQAVESQRELISTSSTVDISGVSGTTRNIKVYSDGSVEVFGVWQNAAGNSFNLTLGVNMVDTTYLVLFAPIHTEVLATRVVSRGTNSCALRFSTLAGVDTSPVFTYSVIGRLSESDLANYV